MNYVLDIDGTLVNSQQRHGLLMDHLLKIQYPELVFNHQDFMQYKESGNSGKKYLIDILGITEVRAQAIMQEWQQKIELEPWVVTDCIYEDTIPFLEKIKNDNILYLSARQRKDVLMDELNRLHILSYASEVFVVSTNNAKQEKKQVVANLLKTTKNLIMIGDSENEYEVAKELEVPVFLLNRGARNCHFWETHGVTSYDNLLDIHRKITVFPLQMG